MPSILTAQMGERMRMARFEGRTDSPMNVTLEVLPDRYQEEDINLLGILVCLEFGVH